MLKTVRFEYAKTSILKKETHSHIIVRGTLIL